MTLDGEARRALDAFVLPGHVLECVAAGGGHINASWRVTAMGSAGERFLLQRLNPRVFPDGDAVMRNVVQVVTRLRETRAPASARGLRLVPTRSGREWLTDDTVVWRLYELIDTAAVHHVAESPRMAEAAAHAFGEFARLTSEPLLQLSAVLPGFHDTRRRLSQLEAARGRDAAGRTAELAAECDRILAERDLAERIPAALERGEIPTRVAHNDAKIANVLFEEGTAEPICVIDLDTVMPGSPLHDFGDLVRSTVSAAPEDAAEIAAVEVRHDFFAAIVRGFLAGTSGLLKVRELALLVEAARSIALEQAARFAADYLDGDVYYRVTDPRQNLRRARNQLALFDALTRQSDRLERLVAGAALSARPGADPLRP